MTVSGLAPLPGIVTCSGVTDTDRALSIGYSCVETAFGASNYPTHGRLNRARDVAGCSERLLTEDEAAELLAVPVSWVPESTPAGAMPCVRLGRYVRFELAAVEAWLEECRRPGRAILLRRPPGEA